MNKIEDVRAEILKYFDPRNSIAGSLENTYSPNNKYRLQTSEFKQTKPDLNWVATKVDIFDNLTGGQLFDFIANERFFHCWVSANDHDYLLCA